MENITSVENDAIEKKSADGLNFLIFRIVFVVLIAISIIVVRYTNKHIYNELKKYYDDYFSVNITAEYYLSEVE